MTVDEALAELGLHRGAPAEVCKAAFRSRVKTYRPDRPEGDPERFRRVIEAYRRLERGDAREAAVRLACVQVEIGIDETCLGGVRRLQLDGGRTLDWRIEPGLRDGDVVCAATPSGEVDIRVRIAAELDRKVMGGDLWITQRVDPMLLEDGGRFEAATPFGPRSVWVPRGLPRGGMLRLKNCGLPPRAGYPQGHAFLKLVPDPALAGDIFRAMFGRLSSAVAPSAHRALKAGVVQ